MIRKYYLFIFLSLLTFISCDDPFEGKTYMEDTISDEPLLNNGEWMTANADRFSLWIEVLKRADQYNAVSDASGDFTLFVPDNEAVKRFFDLKGITSADELDVEYARDLVQYHMIETSISKSLFLVGGRLSRPTTFGTYLSVNFSEGESSEGSGVWINNAAEVIDLAEETTNGFIYTLNNVLLPITETAYDYIANNGEFSIFKEALDLTGWGVQLDRCVDTVISEVGIRNQIKLKYTCLAVPNEAFAVSDIHNINDLIAKTGAASNYTDTTNALYQYIAYHVLNKSCYQEALYPFDATVMDTTIVWPTQGTNTMFSTDMAIGEKYLNYQSFDGIQITESDIEVKNGVLHVLNHYMPLYTPPAVRVIWDFCDYPDVVSVVNKMGANTGYGDCYGIRPTTASLNFSLYASSAITSYEFNYYNSASRDNWMVVGYYLSSLKMDSIRNNNNFYKNTAYPNNNDLLCLNLGYMGWISMQTPAILKGKYQVKIAYMYLNDYMSELTEGGSLTKITLDENEDTSNQVYFYNIKNPHFSETGIHSVEVFSTIEFTETKSHEFKISLQDSRASTFTNYALLLDYVEFIPITE